MHVTIYTAVPSSLPFTYILLLAHVLHMQPGRHNRD